MAGNRPKVETTYAYADKGAWFPDGPPSRGEEGGQTVENWLAGPAARTEQLAQQYVFLIQNPDFPLEPNSFFDDRREHDEIVEQAVQLVSQILRWPQIFPETIIPDDVVLLVDSLSSRVRGLDYKQRRALEVAAAKARKSE